MDIKNITNQVKFYLKKYGLIKGKSKIRIPFKKRNI